MRGKFIVVESNDRSGKTTICKTLINNIPNSIYLKFPDRNGLHGKEINDYLNGLIHFEEDTIFRLFVENRNEYKDRILTWLSDGKNIICDRYSYSGAVYSYYNRNKKNICGNLQQLINLSKYDENMPKPDIVFLIDGYFTSDMNELYDGVEHREYIYNLFKTLLDELKINYSIIENCFDMDDDRYINITINTMLVKINNLI